MLAKSRLLAAAITLLLFSSCTQPPPPTPTPVATAAPVGDRQPRTGDVAAAGKVLPAVVAELAFPAAGRVDSLLVAAGDQVGQDMLLAAVNQAAADNAVIQAQATLFRAQAQVAELQAGARPQEVEAAQAEVDALQARLAQLSDAERPQAVAAARAELAAAQAAYQQLSNGPRTEARIQALVDKSNAEAALQQAQSAYNRVSAGNDVGMLPESRALQQATNNFEAAKARYDALFAAPDADIVAAANAQVQAAQAALDQLLSPATASQIAEAEAQVRSAQAKLDLLKAGATDQALAKAAVDVTEAAAAYELAQAKRADTALRAPFTGTVTSVTITTGEMVQPGQVVVTVADLDNLRVETTDLSERDVARVTIGQPATIYIEALNSDIAGRVAQIAPAANVIGGDVVYTVTIELQERPANLRWGMSADVQIATQSP